VNTIEVEKEKDQEERTSVGELPMENLFTWANQGPLFSDSLLESTKPAKLRRTWATVGSFIIQSLLIGTLVILPLMYTDVLPKQELMTYLVVPPPPPPPPPAAAVERVARARQIESDIVNGELRTPTRIPSQIRIIKEEEPPPTVNTTGGVVGGVPGGVPGGQLGGVIGGIISETSKIPILPRLPKAELPRRVRISQGVSAGLLIREVQPVYPPLARDAHIQGRVILSAIIGKDGTIQNLHLVSGHPLLVPAAISAVRQWRYRPYLLNGEPVEVETEITVNFTLVQ
jgi:protein TonB